MPARASRMEVIDEVSIVVGKRGNLCHVAD